MVFYNILLTIAIGVLFFVNARNQSGIVKLTKEINALKKRLKLLSETLEQNIKQPQDPVYEPIVEQPQESVYEPIVEQDQEPVYEPIIEQDQEPVYEPIVEQPQESVYEPIIEQDQNQVYEPIIEQLKESVVESVESKQSKKTSLFSIESIISKLGIFLFLIGVGYLYKLAYDNGFITEGIAILFGETLGVAIIGLAVYVQKKNRLILSQVLFGGGIATTFIVTYVAYNSYQLITSFVAFFFFVLITFFTFYIALAIDSKTMSVVGVLGAILTPFMVEIDYLGFFGMGIYLIILTIGAMSMYLFKRWRVLQVSTLLGVYFVTTLLMLNGTLSESESIQFSCMLLVLFLLFNGLDYFLLFKNVETKRYPIITPLIFIFVPLISIIHLVEILELSNTSWSILFMGIAIVYIAAYILLYKKRGHNLITNIILSYSGIFTFLGIILFFGGDVRIISILILSLLFYYTSNKMEHFYTRLLGHLVFGIGFIWSLYAFVMSVEKGFDLVSIAVQLLMVLMMVLAALLQSATVKKVMGTLSIEIYGLAILFRMTSEIGRELEPMVVIFATVGIFLWLLLLLYRKVHLISLISLSFVALLPLLAQIIASGVYLFDSDVPVEAIIASVAYCINLYGLGFLLLKQTKPVFSDSLKIGAFLLFILTMLVPVTVETEHIGYGILAVGAFILVMDWIEKNKTSLMKICFYVFFIAYSIGVFIYGFADVSWFNINYVAFLSDFIILVMIYFILKKLQFLDPFRSIIHMVCYMELIYKNLNDVDNGTITLFWAAYGIISLFIYVYYKQKNNTYIALGMIIVVAMKFIFIDLSSVETIYKVITSMVFGTALLILSYFIQPLLRRE